MNKTMDFNITGSKLLKFEAHSWGNRAKANKDEIQTSADKKMFSASIKLVDSPEYKAVVNFQVDTIRWLERMMVKSKIMTGCFHIKDDEKVVKCIEDEIESRSRTLEELVEAFVAVYRTQIDEARDKLQDQWNIKRYPSAFEIRSKFYFFYAWLKVYSDETSLSKKAFQRQQAALEKRMQDCTETITQTLRQSFASLISHATEILKPNKDGKQKGWKDASFDNITQFISVFTHRNITNDVELENLVKKAEEVLSQIDSPQKMKKDKDLLKFVDRSFKQINEELSNMIVTKPSRKFDLE